MSDNAALKKKDYPTDRVSSLRSCTMAILNVKQTSNVARKFPHPKFIICNSCFWSVSYLSGKNTLPSTTSKYMLNLWCRCKVISMIRIHGNNNY